MAIKKGNKEKPSNYKPISLLPVPSKIIEKIVTNQVIKYLEDNDILSHNQFGFNSTMINADRYANFMINADKNADSMFNNENF